MTIKLLIDTDPGIDDAIAIWLALASPELDLLGLSAVLGNGPVEFCAENAIRVLDAAERSEIPVHVGAAQPFVRSYARKGWGVHGRDGLGGIGLKPPSRAVDGHDAIGWMADLLSKAAPHSVTLAPLGPLTNIARLLETYPGAERGIKQLIVMGGATDSRGGNATPHAEYNFWLDPEAADIICVSGVKMTLVTIETARSVSATPDRIARIEVSGGKVAGHVADLLRAYVHESRADALFDPLVMVYLLRPDLFQVSHARFRVETDDSPRLGGLTWQAASDRSPHRLLQAPDPDSVFDFLAARFKHLP